MNWNKVKRGDRVVYSSPVEGHHRAIVCSVVEKQREHVRHLSVERIITLQPLTTGAALRGEVTRDVVTPNHTLWSIY